MKETYRTLQTAYSEIAQQWDDDIIPQLENYIKIPNKSPIFDPHWKAHGHMDHAMQLIVDWCQKQPIKDMHLEVLQSAQRTPLLYIEIPGQMNHDHSILLYGHMDKQPEMTGWDDNKGPWIPLIEDGKLYGRGGADDGYAAFAAISAIATLQKHHIPHAHCVIIIEASEESGSVDLPHYLENLTNRIGNPELVICLDSFCANYEQMWSTTSLRGLIGGNLKIDVLTEGIHSGLGSGVIPSTFQILRELLDRIENKSTGKILLKSLQAHIPKQRIEQAKVAANALGKDWLNAYSFADHTKAVDSDIHELILNRTWHAALSVTGIGGMPSIENAGNVTLPTLEVKLSMRTPPTCDIAKAAKELKATLEKNPPHDATITFTHDESGAGWHAPALSDWLKEASDRASHCFFNKPTGYLGEGGSIPFMGMLGEMYPQAQFLITGVLGPKSNAHGPNEFLHIDMGKKITACVAAVIAEHYHEHAKK